MANDTVGLRMRETAASMLSSMVDQMKTATVFMFPMEVPPVQDLSFEFKRERALAWRDAVLKQLCDMFDAAIDAERPFTVQFVVPKDSRTEFIITATTTDGGERKGEEYVKAFSNRRILLQDIGVM
jgi:hypothetical protein